MGKNYNKMPNMFIHSSFICSDAYTYICVDVCECVISEMQNSNLVLLKFINKIAGQQTHTDGWSVGPTGQTAPNKRIGQINKPTFQILKKVINSYQATSEREEKQTE